eukprot:TRINITY_DN2076_c0_g1_i11.p1 TRINITY_DN2076_c0_g1~~TRINITY_DN2076_c0_g1_i11.p1  ORF type:complete len:781 (-),score=123.33 TRINITY_DN2076_c0_g1_i11:208-2550(-)
MEAAPDALGGIVDREDGFRVSGGNNLSDETELLIHAALDLNQQRSVSRLQNTSPVDGSGAEKGNSPVSGLTEEELHDFYPIESSAFEHEFSEDEAEFYDAVDGKSSVPIPRKQQPTRNQQERSFLRREEKEQHVSSPRLFYQPLAYGIQEAIPTHRPSSSSSSSKVSHASSQSSAATFFSMYPPESTAESHSNLSAKHNQEHLESGMKTAKLSNPPASQPEQKTSTSSTMAHGSKQEYSKGCRQSTNSSNHSNSCPKSDPTPSQSVDGARSASRSFSGTFSMIRRLSMRDPTQSDDASLGEKLPQTDGLSPKFSDLDQRRKRMSMHSLKSLVLPSEHQQQHFPKTSPDKHDAERKQDSPDPLSSPTRNKAQDVMSPRRISLLDKMFRFDQGIPAEEKNHLTMRERRLSWYPNLLKRNSDVCLFSQSESVKVIANKKDAPIWKHAYVTQEFKAHKCSIWSLSVDNQGTLLASGGADGTLFVWDLTGSKRLAQENNEIEVLSLSESPKYVFSGHSAGIVDIKWSKDSFILSASCDKTAILWHTRHDKPIRVFEGKDVITSAAFHPTDETKILTAGFGMDIAIWNIIEKKQLCRIDVGQKVSAALFGKGGRSVIVGTMSGDCLIYDLETLAQTSCITLSRKPSRGLTKVTGIELHPSEDKILVTYSDSTIRMYSLSDSSVHCKYKGFTNKKCHIKASFCESGDSIICGSRDNGIYMWETHSRHLEVQKSLFRDKKFKCDSYELLLANKAIVTSALFAPNRGKTTVICSNAEGSIKVIVKGQDT